VYKVIRRKKKQQIKTQFTQDEQIGKGKKIIAQNNLTAD
jgi:hypothetical protein